MRLHYNGTNSYLFVNGTEIYKSKAKKKTNHTKTLVFTTVDTLQRNDDYESINGIDNTCLVFTSIDGNKEVLAKFTKFWDKIKYLIETINEGKKREYEKDFIKIRFEPVNNLFLNKILKLHMLTVIVRSIFENDQYYPQVILDECLYEV